ncbi:MAG: hypothetical protein JWN48_1067 [Myxococcaceae bacterium]|nr:hypothetical protein [Myxococcaceae bacterium]
MSELFVEEANELLAEFEQALLLLESLPDDEELSNRVFRCAHTIKGNSRILGFEEIASFTHELENLLDHLRKPEYLVTSAIADTLLSSLDLLRAMVAEVGGGPAHDPVLRARVARRIEGHAAELERPHRREPALRPEPPLDFEISERPAPLSAQDRAATVASHGEQDVQSLPVRASRRPRPSSPQDAGRAPALQPAAVVSGGDVRAAAAAPQVEQRLQTGDRRTAGGDRRSPQSDRRAGGAEAESNSVRVPIDKLDRLINLTGEVVIAQSMIAQLVTDLTPERVAMLQEVVAQMDRHCRELQERMLGARMLPIKNVFSRFNRLARDLAAATGKSLLLEVEGEDTELDKTVIEKIADPLTHLVRNAIDHGVDTPAERRAAGKPEQALIRLSAYQSSGNIFIDVADDGRGLNRSKILQKARALGLVSETAEPSLEEIDALIFHPGFSTADEVTEISGRGVGMDVVRRNVETLRGSISILTTPGQGTCFRIKLPLTMAILDGLGLRVGTEAYLVPLVAVVESLQPKKSDIKSLANVGEVVDVRGEYLPLVRLYELFGLTPSFAAADEGLVMVIDDGEQRICLQIDELLGQYQVVIKSLETNFTAVPGVAGATILGDGRVALILDTANLMAMARARARPRVELGERNTLHFTGGSHA